MKAALIEGATHNPGAPKDWKPSDGTCGRLPIRVVMSEDENGEMGISRCLSAWKPTPEELAVLTDGGYVVLHVWGWQVPVAITVVDRKGAQEL